MVVGTIPSAERWAEVPPPPGAAPRGPAPPPARAARGRKRLPLAQPIAVGRRVFPRHPDHGMVVDLEAMARNRARAMGRAKLAELAIRHFPSADFEGARDLNLAEPRVRAAA